MDALILSCGTGGGHNSAARAIAEELESRGHRAVMLNPYTLKSDRLADNINKTYIAAARGVPAAFGAVYKMGDLYRMLPFRSPIYYVNHGMGEVLRSYLEKNQFDIVIMTHLFGAEILTNMKQHGLRIPKAIFVATDYVCTPFTEETECDAYVIPAADLTDDFTGRGIPAEKLYPFGIPTSRCFAEKETKEAAKARLGLKKDQKYILIAGGSMGGGKIEKAITKLQKFCAKRPDVSLLVVCGSNRPLLEKLSARQDPNTTVIGYTDDMASLLRASDLFVTKPGGLSSTEAAVAGVPILHTCPIPGCESCNARYFSERGMSISGNVGDDILKTLDRMLHEEALSAGMRERERTHMNPHAAADICSLAEKMTTEIADGGIC